MKTQSYLFDYTSKNYNEEIRFFLNLFESFFLAQHGTTIKYKNGNDLFEPILEDLEYSEKESKVFKNIQKGAIYFIKDYQKINIDFSVSTSFENLKRLGIEPNLKDVKLFEKISYLETSKNAFANPKSIIFYLLNPKKLYIDFSNSSWKIGFLKKLLKLKLNYQKILKVIYSKLEK